VALRFEEDEYESGLMKLHVSQAMVCNKQRYDSNDLKPGTNLQSVTLRTMRQYLIDLVFCVKWQSVAKNDWFRFVGLFLVYCHSCRLNVGWSFLDEAETVRYFFRNWFVVLCFDKKV